MNNSGQIGKQIRHVFTFVECSFHHYSKMGVP
jgi:hypothetical protein